jgi:hypothetical protein
VKIIGEGVGGMEVEVALTTPGEGEVQPTAIKEKNERIARIRISFNIGDSLITKKMKINIDWSYYNMKKLLL